MGELRRVTKPSPGSQGGLSGGGDIRAETEGSLLWEGGNGYSGQGSSMCRGPGIREIMTSFRVRRTWTRERDKLLANYEQVKLLQGGRQFSSGKGLR